jgi:hypothetical protein
MHKTRTRFINHKAMPVQFYKAISSIYDENSTYQRKQRKNQHHLKILSIHNEEDLSHQNRGESSEIRR